MISPTKQLCCLIRIRSCANYAAEMYTTQFHIGLLKKKNSRLRVDSSRLLSA